MTNCTCENHGWFGDGHCSACAASIIEALERECDKRDAVARKLVENWSAARRKSDNQRLEIIKLRESIAKWIEVVDHECANWDATARKLADKIIRLKAEIAKLDPDNDLL